jgi:uncharacterized protein YndB with AHSA1/START domain
VTDNTTFTHELHIDAPPEMVFSYFTDPAKMARWIGIDHKLDPVPGGVLVVDVNGDNVAMGEFIEVDPPTRVVFSWGWRDSPDMPPGSTTVEVNLTADGDGTMVHLTHRGLPPGQVEPHRRGWTHFLARLAIAGAGGDPGPDPMATPSR